MRVLCEVGVVRHGVGLAGVVKIVTSGVSELRGDGCDDAGRGPLLDRLVSEDSGGLCRVELLFALAPVALTMPLLMALPSILTTFLLVLGLEQLIAVNSLVQYLVAFIGLLLGWPYTLTALFYGVFLAGLVSVGIIIWNRSMKGSIAYGPYLAIGALIVLWKLP